MRRPNGKWPQRFTALISFTTSGLTHVLQSTLVTPQGTLTLIGLLAQLSSVLQSRRFASFWTLLDSPEFQSLNPLISTIRDFDDLIRRSIGQSVASCFRSITLSRLQTYLGLSDLAEVRKWVEEFGWSIIEEKGQTVAKAQIPDNSDNRPVTTVTRENTTLEGMPSRLFLLIFDLNLAIESLFFFFLPCDRFCWSITLSFFCCRPSTNLG